jgi:hypothetical protein
MKFLNFESSYRFLEGGSHPADGLAHNKVVFAVDVEVNGPSVCTTSRLYDACTTGETIQSLQLQMI